MVRFINICSNGLTMPSIIVLIFIGYKVCSSGSSSLQVLMIQVDPRVKNIDCYSRTSRYML